MVLLILIALIQLGVLVLILGCLNELVARETVQEAAERSIRDVQRQTVASMFTVANAPKPEPTDS